jgi:hypothetical protein
MKKGLVSDFGKSLHHISQDWLKIHMKQSSQAGDDSQAIMGVTGRKEWKLRKRKQTKAPNIILEQLYQGYFWS